MTTTTSRLAAFADAVSHRITGEVAVIDTKVKAAVSDSLAAINTEFDALKAQVVNVNAGVTAGATATDGVLATISQALATIQADLKTLLTADPGDLAAVVAAPSASLAAVAAALAPAAVAVATTPVAVAAVTPTV